MTDYPTIDDKLATLRNAIEGGVKADSAQAMHLMELVDAIGEQFKRELADAAPVADSAMAKDAERYHHLRECNSGSLVIVQIMGTGDDDQVVLTESDADAAIDAAIAASEEQESSHEY
ncbi:hypothetical protein J8I87_06195 [Paraburkholderia sp. LEh10]|uniref:hypothetical protein n=1 Tax=Paraburkholderia sp. LEh10 TaxID=2821353 RepID=UPI001AE55ECC|nr:hypothetical protein [Paraburkholderia sp. LEh10]MBP0589315.1 hypothetical protein [Paraburkholderia sp. LEh10]